MLPIGGGVIVLTIFSVVALFQMIRRLTKGNKAKRSWRKARKAHAKNLHRKMTSVAPSSNSPPNSPKGKTTDKSSPKHQKRKTTTSARAQQMDQSFSNAITQATSMLITMTYFLFVLVSKTALAPFNCVPTRPPSGHYFMADRPLEECFVAGRLQQRLAQPAWLFLIFYVAGFPLGIGWLFYKNRQIIKHDQLLRARMRGDTSFSSEYYQFRRRYSRLYYQFQPEYFYWILVLIARKFFICLIGVLFRSAPTFQLAFAIVIIFAAFVLQVYHEPYMDVKEAGEIVHKQTQQEILKLSRMLFMIRRLTKGTSDKIISLEERIEAETR